MLNCHYFVAYDVSVALDCEFGFAVRESEHIVVLSFSNIRRISPTLEHLLMALNRTPFLRRYFLKISIVMAFLNNSASDVDE